MATIKDEDWNPGYWKWNSKLMGEEFIAYEKRWFCEESKIIHTNLKEKQNCKYCLDK